MTPEATFSNPPKEFSVLPFWFWNDELNAVEITRQIADMEAHGVYGFVIHPRIGLPRHQTWMSPGLLDLMAHAIAEAARRGMKVVLYDEGMYPSGSACGQVVAKNPAHAARALAFVPVSGSGVATVDAGWKILQVFSQASGQSVAVVDRPSGGVVRGLHYIGDENGAFTEEEPLAADILNPEAVASFVELVYGRFAKQFAPHFGNTVIGIFTDEPAEMGRVADGTLVPGSAAVLGRVSKILGYDFTPHLLSLWQAESEEALRHRRAYHRALHQVLGETYYQTLSAWCETHGVALMGHPGASDDLGFERHFHVPGQDLVWRYVEPGPKALEGPHSTMAKCASSAMVHLGRRRNGNELYGAYGHDLTFDEVKWLANWCLVRGQNLLYPHAFYYSMRGPRRDERPPDVGPNSPWWAQFKPFADHCRRLSWINTDCQQVCQIAVLAGVQELPFRAAKVIFENQFDFNYLEWRHLWEDARLEESGLHLAGMVYQTVIFDGLELVPAEALPVIKALAAAGRLICHGPETAAWVELGLREKKTADADGLVAALSASVQKRLTPLSPCSDLRVRHVVKGGRDIFFLFNEGASQVSAKLAHDFRDKKAYWWDGPSGGVEPASLGEAISWAPFEMKLLVFA